jgi:hypothetical protein
MKYPNESYRARYRQAQNAAQNLAELACYEQVSEPVLFPPALRDGLTDPACKLTLLPSAGDLPRALRAAVAETRTDLLIILPGKTTNRLPTFYFTLLRCARGEVHLHEPLRLWAGIERQLYLLPDPHGDDPQGQCFVLAKGVRLAERPWTNELERDRGLTHGDALLLAS